MTLQRIRELSAEHVGLRVRLQNIMGGYIEGTLASVNHTISAPYSTTVMSRVQLEEFTSPVRGDRISFQVNGVDSASIIDE